MNTPFFMDFFSIMRITLDNQFGATRCGISLKSLELVLLISMKKDPCLIVAEHNMHKCCFCSFCYGIHICVFIFLEIWILTLIWNVGKIYYPPKLKYRRSHIICWHFLLKKKIVGFEYIYFFLAGCKYYVKIQNISRFAHKFCG